MTAAFVAILDISLDMGISNFGGEYGVGAGEDDLGKTGIELGSDS